MKTTAYTIAIAIVAAFAGVNNAKAYNPYSPYWPKAETSVPPISKTIEVKDATVSPISKTIEVKDATVSPTWTMGFPW